MTKLSRSKDEIGSYFIIESDTLTFGTERVRISTRKSQGKYAIVWAGWYPIPIERRYVAKAIREARSIIKAQKYNDKFRISFA